MLDSSHLLVLEWTADLFGDITLHNTLDELSSAAFGARNAANRHAQWGFMFCRVAHPHHCPLPAPALRLKAAAWDKGVPRIYVKAAKQTAAASKPRPATTHNAKPAANNNNKAKDNKRKVSDRDLQEAGGGGEAAEEDMGHDEAGGSEEKTMMASPPGDD